MLEHIKDDCKEGSLHKGIRHVSKYDGEHHNVIFKGSFLVYDGNDIEVFSHTSDPATFVAECQKSLMGNTQHFPTLGPYTVYFDDPFLDSIGLTFFLKRGCVNGEYRWRVYAKSQTLLEDLVKVSVEVCELDRN